MKPTKALFLFLLLSLPGCFGTETGNPSFALMSIDAHSSDPDSVSVREATGDVVIDQAWVTFGRVALAPSCDGAELRASDVLGTGDHSEPGPLSFDIELDGRASFCRLIAPLEPLEGTPPAGAPPELAGRSIVILARLTDGTDVRVVSAFEGDVTVDAAFTLEEDAAGLFLGMDVARWFSGVDLSAATREADGSIVLDDDTNTALRDALDARVPMGIELYRDANADGVLDDPPVLIGRGG
jgi:hypothetical protein